MGNRLNYGLIEDIYSLAACYATAVSQAHCFNDGNKRTVFQVMELILDINGINVNWDLEAVGQKMCCCRNPNLMRLILLNGFGE